jgi:hypothetical protein
VDPGGSGSSSLALSRSTKSLNPYPVQIRIHNRGGNYYVFSWICLYSANLSLLSRLLWSRLTLSPCIPTHTVSVANNRS